MSTHSTFCGEIREILCGYTHYLELWLDQHGQTYLGLYALHSAYMDDTYIYSLKYLQKFAI